MRNITIEQVLESIDSLGTEDQVYVLEVLSKRIIELRRRSIAEKAREAEKAYKKGRVKRGSVDDLWKDLNG